MTICEEGHIVQLFNPQTQSAALTSEIFSMKNWNHATIILHGGSGSAATIQLSDTDAFAVGNQETMAFQYAEERSAGEDVLTALQTAATAGIAWSGEDGSLFVIEVDSAELRDGFPQLVVNISAAGARDLSGIAVLTVGRFQKDITATAES